MGDGLGGDELIIKLLTIRTTGFVLFIGVATLNNVLQRKVEEVQKSNEKED